MHLAPIFAEQFSKILNMPRNGPDHKKGLAYSITKENLAVISVDTFEDAGDRMSMTVSGKQLEWLKNGTEEISGQAVRYRAGTRASSRPGPEQELQRQHARRWHEE